MNAAASISPQAGEPTPEAVMRHLRLVTLASFSTAVVLSLAKAGGWLVTDSVAMLSALIDSLLDALASLLTLFAVRHALVPADREHRFGHGKAEALAGLAQSAFVSGSAVLLLFQAGQRLLNPRQLEQGQVGIAIMLFSIALTVVLVVYQRYVIRRSGSLAIAGDSLHYLGDLITNIAVIAAIALTGWLGWLWLDPLFGIGIAVYILYGAWQIGRGALDQLMDRELPDEDRRRIREIVLAHDHVLDMHDLRTRASGLQTFIQLHLEMDPELRLRQAHVVSEAVEARLREAFPGAEVIIHEDPAGIEEPRAEFPR